MRDGFFGDAAARLSAAASFLLNWRPDEFWSATPAELALAMSLHDPLPNVPDADVIEQLRHRFPDDEKA